MSELATKNSGTLCRGVIGLQTIPVGIFRRRQKLAEHPFYVGLTADGRKGLLIGRPVGLWGCHLGRLQAWSVRFCRSIAYRRRGSCSFRLKLGIANFTSNCFRLQNARVPARGQLIMLSTGFAVPVALDQLKSNSATANPSNLPGGTADHQRIVRDVFCYNGTRPDKGVLANGCSAHNRGIGAQTGSSSYKSSLILILSIHVTSRINDVGKDHRRSAKHVVF